jgi:uncharacterized protein YidB (DUF937 family)
MEDVMGLMDDLVKGAGGLMHQAGGLATLAAQNPQAVAAIVSMLSTRDQSVGGTSGLGGVVEAFQKKGLGDMVASWISTGPNPPVSASQVTDVLGKDILGQFAAKAGVPQGQAGGLLASLLPAVIDHLTPDGTVPATASLENSLGGLLSGLLK